MKPLGYYFLLIYIFVMLKGADFGEEHHCSRNSS